MLAYFKKFIVATTLVKIQVISACCTVERTFIGLETGLSGFKFRIVHLVTLTMKSYV